MRLIFLMSLACFGCSSFKATIEKIPQDSYFEEIIEQIIDDKVGIDFDLTPFSVEGQNEFIKEN